MCDINNYQQEYTAVYKCLRTPPNNRGYNGPRCRYLLKKEGKNPLIIIGCNPSDADEGQSDQTMITVSKFCKINGYGGYIMLNLYPQINADVHELPHDIDDINNINYVINSVNIKIINKTLKQNRSSDILFAFGTIVNTRIILFRTCYNSIRVLISRLIHKGIINNNQIKKLALGDAEGNVIRQFAYPPHFSNRVFNGENVQRVFDTVPFDFEAYHI